MQDKSYLESKAPLNVSSGAFPDIDSDTVSSAPSCKKFGKGQERRGEEVVEIGGDER